MSVKIPPLAPQATFEVRMPVSERPQPNRPTKHKPTPMRAINIIVLPEGDEHIHRCGRCGRMESLPKPAFVLCNGDGSREPGRKSATEAPAEISAPEAV